MRGSPAARAGLRPAPIPSSLARHHPPSRCGLRTGGMPLLLAWALSLLARAIGQATPLPSIALAGELTPYGLEGVHPTIISSTVSWSSPSSPVLPQFSPRDAFDELFDAKGLAREKSYLDIMQREIGRMRGEISTADRRKLDEFTDSVRDLETRIDHATAHVSGWRPALAEPDMLRPAQSTTQAMALPLGVRHKLMIRIMALAFHMDKTRVATLVLERDGSYVSMGFVPEVGNIGLHTLAHHSSEPESVRLFQLTNEYHVSLLASLMEKMQAVDEGGSTLLDNSMILFGSNVCDNHNPTNIPLVLAGGGGGTLKPGSCLTFTKREDRRLCNLHLALLQRMGVTVDGRPIERFGNSIKPLEGIRRSPAATLTEHTMSRLIACLLTVAFAQPSWAAEPAAPAAPDAPAPNAKPPPVGELIHDLRDFLPESESKVGNADDPIQAFSVKEDGYWRKYRSFNKNGTGYLSRTEIVALVADLVKSLRVNYPEVYSEIDTDGDDTVTAAKFSAYLNKKR
jgi:hypothetical protein